VHNAFEHLLTALLEDIDLFPGIMLYTLKYLPMCWQNTLAYLLLLHGIFNADTILP